jgi:hypothetical protein
VWADISASITRTSDLARHNFRDQAFVPAPGNIVYNMVFLIVFVGLFCDAIEKGERAHFADFDRRKSKNGSNIDARADIVALSGDFFDQRTNQICQNCDAEKCDAVNCDVTDVNWQT